MSYKDKSNLEQCIVETKFLFTALTYFLSAVIFSTESLCCFFLQRVLPRNNLSPATHLSFSKKQTKWRRLWPDTKCVLVRLLDKCSWSLNLWASDIVETQRGFFWIKKFLNLCKTFGSKCVIQKRLTLTSPPPGRSSNGFWTQAGYRRNFTAENTLW